MQKPLIVIVAQQYHLQSVLRFKSFVFRQAHEPWEHYDHTVTIQGTIEEGILSQLHDFKKPGLLLGQLHELLAMIDVIEQFTGPNIAKPFESQHTLKFTWRIGGRAPTDFEESVHNLGRMATA